MCEGLCHPYRNGFSGVCRAVCSLTAMLRASYLFKKPDWLKKVECQKSSIFKLPSSHVTNQNQKQNLWSDVGWRSVVKKSDESDGHIEVQKLIRRRQG